MEGTENPFTFITIGEMVQKYREHANLTLSQLAERAGISKGVISKLESNETKRPELKTLKVISQAIEIPYAEMLQLYLDIESRTDALQTLLKEAVETANVKVIAKVAQKYLESPHQDTYTALQHVYELAQSQDVEQTIKLALHEVMRRYARDRGIQRYFAKSSFQKYLIERDDFTRLQETYNAGKGLLDYSNFLPHNDRVLMYYKLGVHAYNLQLFEECIDLCSRVVEEDKTQSRMKAKSIYAISNSYYYLKNYELSKRYLDQYEQFSFPEVAFNVKLLSGAIECKLSNYDKGFRKLQECLQECGESELVHVVNQLMEFNLELNNLELIQGLIELEPTILQTRKVTPYKKAQLATYYKLKGDYLIKQGKWNDGIDSYVKSVLEYGKVSSHMKGYESLALILNCYIQHNEEIDISLLKKLSNVYNFLSNT